MEVKVIVSVFVNGEKYEQELSHSNFRLYYLLKAIQNGKNPTRALALIAKIGAIALVDKNLAKAYKQEIKECFGQVFQGED